MILLVVVRNILVVVDQTHAVICVVGAPIHFNFRVNPPGVRIPRLFIGLEGHRTRGDPVCILCNEKSRPREVARAEPKTLVSGTGPSRAVGAETRIVATGLFEEDVLSSGAVQRRKYGSHGLRGRAVSGQLLTKFPGAPFVVSVSTSSE